MKIIETNLPFKRTHTRRQDTDLIVIHHMAGNKNGTAKIIHQMHIDRGWYGIGYHYFIRWDGMIERGRPEWAIGAHSVPVNIKSIGICLAGDLTKHELSDAQIRSLVWLVKDILTRYPGRKVVGHSDTDATACPGNLFPWAQFRKLLEVSGVKVLFNGRETQIPTRLLDGRTEVLLSGFWVQLRALVELIPGAEIKWDAPTQMVNIIIP